MGLRILTLSDYLPPHVGGGVEKVVAELCEGLVRRGHTVTALGLNTGSAPAVETDREPAIRRVPTLDLTRTLGFQFAISIHIVPALIKTIRTFRPDLIHAHNLFFRTTELAALFSTMSHIPLVTTLHLARMEDGPAPLRILTRLYESTLGKFIVRRSDHTIAVSQAVANHARRLGNGRRPVTVVPNGVDTSLFHPGAGRHGMGQTVLFVGRLVSNKGPQTLIRAVPQILARHPACRYMVVGDGPLRETLRRQARELGVEHAVTFLGTRDDVPRLMREAAVFVRPSSLEGMPLTVLEAMASGLPVVATPVGGTPEIVSDGSSGYLFPVGDETELARSIIRLLDEPQSASAMGMRGRELVEDHYTWDRAVARTEQVYTQVLSR